MKAIITLLRGIDLPPGLVGGLRGVFEGALLFALIGVAQLALDLDWGMWEMVRFPLVMFAFRQLEAVVDHVDPAKKRAVDELPPSGTVTAVTGTDSPKITTTGAHGPGI